MNLFLRELQANRKSTIIWIASLAGIVVLFMAMYPAFTSDVEAIKKVMQGFPPALQAAFGLNLETFFSVLGFYGYLLNFAVLAAAIQAMNLGVAAISKEVAGKTADFLISKPITRTRIIAGKFGAALLLLLITNILFIGVSYVAVLVATSEPFDVGTFFLLSLSMLQVQLIFLALGALFSVLLPKVKSVVAVSLPAVFGFYIIGTIGDLLENEEVRFVSPFRYFNYNNIIKDGAYEMEYVLIGAAFLVVAGAATYLIFRKQDIRAAA